MDCDHKHTECYVLNGRSDGALWFPSSDVNAAGNIERYTFELEVTVPTSYVVVASGELRDQSYTDQTKSKKTYSYEVDLPVTPSSIGLAIAPFTIDVDPKVVDPVPVTHF